MGVVILYCFISLIVFCDAAHFDVHAKDKEDITTKEGDQVISISIFGRQETFERGNCSGWCELNQRENVAVESCMVEPLELTADEKKHQVAQQKVIQLAFSRINVTQSHSGPWNCQIKVQQRSAQESSILTQSLNVNVVSIENSKNQTEPAITGVTWIYIGCGIASVVLLIIIGQTIIILHLKAKARKAEIDKNLTQKNSSTDRLADARYVKTKPGGGAVRESVIYEALDPVRGGLAPPPPPIETLPGTPKLQVSRHLSQSMASLHPGQALTTPRLPPPVREIPGKFNTVDRSTSLERIKRRPPLPLPKEEIYEVMEVEPSPQMQKSGRSNFPPSDSPQVAKKQRNPFFGRRAMEPESPNNPDWPTPAKPPSPGPTRRPMMPSTTGQNVPGPSGRHPIGPNGHPLPVPMLVLPGMISTSNLKPVKTAAKPSLVDIAKKPSRENIWIPPGQNPRFQPPGDNTHFQPPGVNSRFQPSGDGTGFQPPGDNTHFQPQGDNTRFQPPGNNTRFQPPTDNTRFQPTGDNPRFQPPGHIPRFQPPGNNPRFQSPGHNPRFQPPGHNPRFQPPGDDPRFQPPGDDPRFQLPGDDPRFQSPENNHRFQTPGEIPRFKLPAQIPPRFHQSPTETPRSNQSPESSRFQPPIQNFTQSPDENRYQPAFVPPPETKKYPRQGDSKMAGDPRMALAQAFNKAFNPQLPIHPKPPMPSPQDIEPETYYGSDEEPDPEFDNYDVLPDFRIYGNALREMSPK